MAKVAEHPILSLSATERPVQSSSRYFDPVSGQAFDKFLGGGDRLTPGEAWDSEYDVSGWTSYLFLKGLKSDA